LCKTKSYRDLGLNIDELKDAARPYTTKDGKKILKAGQFDGNFEDFFNSKGVTFQKGLVGPNRLRLMKEGKIEFSDLVDDAGDIRLLRKGKDGGYVGIEGIGSTTLFKMSDDINWKGLNTGQQEAITRAFNKVQNKTDIDLKLRGVRAFTVQELDMGKAVTIADMNGGVLRINPKLFNDEFIKELNYKVDALGSTERRLARLNNKIKDVNISASERALISKKIQRQKDKIKTYKNVRYGVAENMDDVITHELGHEIQFALDTNSTYGYDFMRPSLLRKEGVKFESTLQSSIDAISFKDGGLVSEYATVNGLEYFAESFLSYSKGEKGLVNPRLTTLFKKIMRRQ